MLQQGVNMSSSTYNPSSDLLAMISRGMISHNEHFGSSTSASAGVFLFLHDDKA
jgi:ferredoxin-thioredoxin reductase catalytic subunit